MRGVYRPLRARHRHTRTTRHRADRDSAPTAIGTSRASRDWTRSIRPSDSVAVWRVPHVVRSCPPYPGEVKEPASIAAPEVAALFASYPDAVRRALLGLRQLILDTADATAGVGAIEEALKWGQPSFITSETRSGSTIRIAPTGPKSTHDYAMYFICHTNLVENFEVLFGDVFTYEGNRALLFSLGATIPENELRECVAMALTYHLAKV